MLQTLVALQAFALATKDRFTREDGAAVVEYGIVLAFVVVTLGAVLTVLGGSISAWFVRIGGAIAGFGPSAAPE